MPDFKNILRKSLSVADKAMETAQPVYRAAKFGLKTAEKVGEYAKSKFGNEGKRDVIKSTMQKMPSAPMVRSKGKLIPLKPVAQQQREDMAAQ